MAKNQTYSSLEAGTWGSQEVTSEGLGLKRLCLCCVYSECILQSGMTELCVKSSPAEICVTIYQ